MKNRTTASTSASLSTDQGSSRLSCRAAWRGGRLRPGRAAGQLPLRVLPRPSPSSGGAPGGGGRWVPPPAAARPAPAAGASPLGRVVRGLAGRRWGDAAVVDVDVGGRALLEEL